MGLIQDKKKQITVLEMTRFLSEEVGMIFTNLNGKMINTQTVWTNWLDRNGIDTR